MRDCTESDRGEGEKGWFSGFAERKYRGLKLKTWYREDQVVLGMKGCCGEED